MIDVKEYDVKEKMCDVIEKAQKMAMSAICFIYDDVEDEHTVSHDELDRLCDALNVLHKCNELILHRHI